jgi:DNA-binding FadR family transcriptional regulator
MRRLAATGAGHDFMLHDVQFHRLIVEGSGNRTLNELWTSLHVEARTMITFIRHGDLHSIAESHVPILEALRACDPERSSAALRAHFEYYAAVVADPAPEEPPPGHLTLRRRRVRSPLGARIDTVPPWAAQIRA